EVNLMTSYEFNADEWVTEVGVGGPITDTLGLRLAYNHTESDGFLFDTIQNRPTPSINNDSFRGTVAFDPTDNFDATLKIEYSDNSEEGGLLQVVGCNASLAPNFGPACNPQIFTTPGFEDDFDLNLSRAGIIQGVPQRDSNDLEIVNGSFAMNLDIAGGHKISSVTGFVDYTNERFLDVDGGPASFAQAQRFENFQQWSQEFRLESPSDQRLTYMLGVYYEDATLDYLEDARTPAPFIAPSQFDQDQRTIALFGSATYELTDALNLTFGARWSSVETDATKFQQVLLTDGTPAPPPILAVAAMPGPNPRDNHDLDESRTDSDFNPSVEIQWYATDNAMLYASYKQAFKTGGFDPNLRLGSLADPANTPNDPNGAFEFDDEKAKAWDVGAKTEFFDNAVTLNIAAFRTTFEDLQVQSFDPGSNSFVTGNAGASRSQGVEIEGIWRATSYLTFNTSMTFLDGEFTDYDSAQCNNAQTAAFLAQVPPPPATAQCITSIDGQTTPFSPDFSGSAGYDFTFPIAGNLDFVSSGRVTFTTEYSWGENPDPEEIQGGFAKLDLRAGIAGNDGQWELAFVGKNLTDELTFRFLGELPGNVGRFAAADRNRELGIQARVNF
ncbi:MAG: TonB-dependent receptor, partial [Pseudomonadota bacterium]